MSLQPTERAFVYSLLGGAGLLFVCLAGTVFFQELARQSAIQEAALAETFSAEVFSTEDSANPSEEAWTKLDIKNNDAGFRGRRVLKTALSESKIATYLRSLAGRPLCAPCIPDELPPMLLNLLAQVRNSKDAKAPIDIRKLDILIQRERVELSEYRPEVVNLLRRLQDALKGVAADEEKLLKYQNDEASNEERLEALDARWSLLEDDWEEFVDLRVANPGSRKLYSGGLLVGLPVLSGLGDNLSSAANLRNALKEAGGEINLKGKAASSEFGARLKNLQRTAREILDSSRAAEKAEAQRKQTIGKLKTEIGRSSLKAEMLLVELLGALPMR